jgi:UDPglucose--hexose-1-phosphate uridylyltransferase
MTPERDPGCPLCPGNEHETPAAILTVAGADRLEPWALRVVPNLYPIVSPAVTGTTGTAPLLRGRPVTGIHELVVETPLHDKDLPDREQKYVQLLFEVLQARLRHLAARPSTRYVVIFKNKGIEAGTSLHHPHSQIVALDFVPDAVRHRVQIARRFHAESGNCLLCSIVDEERRAGARIVFESDGFVAFAPYASGSAGEALLVPLQHAPSFTTTPAVVCEQLGRSLVALLRRTREAFADPAYNLVLHTAPKRWLADPALHWYWQITPRLTRAAGFELGTGLVINSLAPEEAAAALRDAPGRG